MTDEIETRRATIRAVIRQEWGLKEGELSPEATALAERIDRALFELPEEQERALEQWAVDELAARQRTRTALAELTAEVRRLLYLYDGDIERRSSVGIDQCPRIAKLLASGESL